VRAHLPKHVVILYTLQQLKTKKKILLIADEKKSIEFGNSCRNTPYTYIEGVLSGYGNGRIQVAQIGTGANL